jgi:hypothetical protein
MNAKSLTLKIMAVLLTAAILAGCSLGSATLPATITVPTNAPTDQINTEPTTSAPTVDLQPTLDAVKTQAAETVVAEMTLNAPPATPIPPTDTATAIITQAPTKTPVPPTATFIPWTATPLYTATPKYTSTPQGYACSVISTSPKSTDTIKVNVDFDGNWVVKNTGTITWDQAATDLKYISGTKFQTKADVFDFKSSVAADAQYTAVVDMKAPSSAGTYTATWAVVQNSLTLCTLNLSITVTN